MPTRLQLKGNTLEGLEAKVLNDFPPGTRIVTAEKITEGGIAGFLARHYFEAVVEVPDPPVIKSPPAATASSQDPIPPVPDRAGVAALLRDADKAEDTMRKTAAGAPEHPPLSTESGEFGALLEGLSGTLGQRPDDEPDVPALLDTPGSAIMIIGLGPDALTVARSMASTTNNALIRTAGAFRAEGYEHLVSRNALVTARATAALKGTTVFVAFGIAADGMVSAPALTEMDADQVWLAVDATRKPSDTINWTRKAGWASKTDALAVLRSQDTLTPQSVNDLGIPIGWLDDRPATRPVL